MSNSKRKSHCGKVKHLTLLSAQFALKRTLRSKNKDVIFTGMSAYKCQHCDGFHVGRDIQKGINWERVEAHDRKLREQCRARAGMIK